MQTCLSGDLQLTCQNNTVTNFLGGDATLTCTHPRKGAMTDQGNNCVNVQFGDHCIGVTNRSVSEGLLTRNRDNPKAAAYAETNSTMDDDF